MSACRAMESCQSAKHRQISYPPTLQSAGVGMCVQVRLVGCNRGHWTLDCGRCLGRVENGVQMGFYFGVCTDKKTHITNRELRAIMRFSHTRHQARHPPRGGMVVAFRKRVIPRNFVADRGLFVCLCVYVWRFFLPAVLLPCFPPR